MIPRMGLFSINALFSCWTSFMLGLCALYCSDVRQFDAESRSETVCLRRANVFLIYIGCDSQMRSWDHHSFIDTGWLIPAQFNKDPSIVSIKLRPKEINSFNTFPMDLEDIHLHCQVELIRYPGQHVRKDEKHQPSHLHTSWSPFYFNKHSRILQQ